MLKKSGNRSTERRFSIDTAPIRGTLKTLQPLTIQIASQTHLEPLWDQLVNRYHYLGYQRLLGHRLKYLVFMQDRPVAALSWSAPALKLRVRDKYIGWSGYQRKSYLDRLANNSRFLILPWVHVPNLASHVLSLNIDRLNRDWEEQFNKRLWLLETFVDPCRFTGTSYKAANWQFIGNTYGYGKQGKGYYYHGSVKEVYLYVLEPRFREIIGCEQKPYSLFHRPTKSFIKVDELHMILRQFNWNPDLVPFMELTEEDIKAIADELVEFHKQFYDCFGRAEHLRLGLAYVSGLISNSKAKSIEPIALEFLNEEAVRSMQRFMKTYRWNEKAMERKHQSMLSAKISSADGMINVDSCEFVKKGKESVGVVRQYCGAVGKVENCQSGVFVGYSSDKGYGLLSCRLYLPNIWFSHEYEQRRKDTLVPEDIVFQTKPQIARNLINKVVETGLFPARWIGCDTTFGTDPDFLKSLPGSMYYFANIKSNTKVFVEKPIIGIPPYSGRGAHSRKIKVLPGEPQAKTVYEIAKSPDCPWTFTIIVEGAKCPIIAEIARLRVYPWRDTLSEDCPVWLFIRRTSEGQIKYAFCNAPEDMPLSEMCKASTMRWPIEQFFQDGKEQVGMDAYEHRSWTAWHRHMIYVFLALHFLLQLRIKFKKNSGLDTASSQQAGGCTTSVKD
ncbi:MAG: IS701 family transposase [Nitrospirota bacterium]